MEKGLVHLYTGGGKGKTSAALGLCLRANGQRLSVAFIQFLKNGHSGELTMLERIGVHVDAPECDQFLWEMDDNQRQFCQIQQQALFERAKKLAPEMDVLVLDEAAAAAFEGLIDIEDLLDFIVEKPEGMELVITGRCDPAPYEPYCDYITEMREIKHPLAQGQPARRGIEF